MKRLLLPLIFLLLLTAKGFAQCDTPLQNVIENFNTQPDPNNLAVLPACWQAVYTAPYQGREVGSVQIYNGKLIINSTYGGIAFTPMVQNANGKITFKARKAYSGAMSLEMGFYDGSTFYVAQTFVLSATQQTLTYDFASYSGYSNNYIAFRHKSSNGSAVNIELDDIEYKSYCLPAANPTAVAKDITVKLDASGNVIVNPSQVNNGSTDDCGELITNLSLDKTLFTCAELGDNVVTLTATDSQGQTATATATIKVEPNIQIGASYIYLPASGEEPLNLTYLLSSSTTKCDAITYSISHDKVTCAELGTLTVTVTATYAGGTATYNRGLYILDENAPTVKTKNISVTIDAATGEAVITPEMIDNGSTDNCSVASMSLSQKSFNCSDQGENVVTLTVVDASGNSASGTAVVTVGSFVNEVEVTSDAQTVCFGESASSEGATISTSTSELGVDYYLRKTSDHSVVVGPVAGTGQGLTFNTGSISENTTFEVYAEIPFSGHALSLPNSNEYLSVNAPGSFDYTQGYTFSAWINEPSGGNSTMFNTLFYAGGATGSDIEIYQNSSSGAFTILHNRDNGGTLSYYNVATNYLPNAQWVHFAVTFDGTTSRIYVNGELKNTNAIGAPIKSASSELTFGYLNGSTFPAAQVFEGKFDDVRIYNEARTAEQLADDMRSCATSSDPALLLHYDMESANGSILTDQVNGTPGQVKNLVRGGIVSDGAISCSYTCNRLMATQITIGDDQAPVALTKDLTFDLDESGTLEITPQMVDNGSSDNCSAQSALIISLDKTHFDCNHVGENVVMFTVTDEAGNSTSKEVTITINPLITDAAVSAAATEFCPGDNTGTTVTLVSSVDGIDYFLRNSAENQIVAGPIKGTGSALSFETGALTQTTTFNVFGSQERPTGTALAFDGINDFVNAGTDNRDISNMVTVSAWVKSNKTGAYNMAISKYNGATGFLLYISADGSPRIDGRDNTGVYKTSGNATTKVNDNLWHQITGTINTATGEWKIYVDGKLENAATNATGGVLSSAKALTIGSLDSDYFFGEIDQVVIYNQILDDATILANSNACTEPDLSGAVAYFDFNQVTGTIATDLSAKAINATLTNMDPATDWIVTTPEANCTWCEQQMTQEVTITVGDETAPNVLTKNIGLVLGANGTATLSPASVNNGSTDNCTAEANLLLSLDKTSFDLTNLGENTVILTVADQNGNSASATASVTVSDKEQQQVVVTGISDKTFGDPDFSVSATIDSGLPMNLSVQSGKIVLKSSENGSATFGITGAGQATIRVSNDGNETYAPLVQDISFSIAKSTQVLEVTEVSTKATVSAPVTISATVNTGLELTYEIVSGPATVSANVVSLTGQTGTVEVKVSQAGNDDYLAVSKTISFEVLEKQTQNITFSDLSDEVTYGQSGITLTATSSSALPVSFSVLSGNATIGENVLMINGVGEVVVAANQAGNDLILAADQVTQTITVVPASLVATASNQSMTFGSTVPELTVSYAGFVNGEGVSVLTSAPVASTSATSSSNVGNYTIDLSGGDAANYTFTLVSGTLTILQATASITISDLNYIVDGTAKQPTVTTNPAGLNFTITYDGSTDAPSAEGSYTVLVRIDELNYVGQATATLVIAPELVLGLKDHQLKIYPNPAVCTLTIESKTADQVTIYDLTGQQVMQSQTNVLVDVSGLPAGTYLLRVGQQDAGRFIKQ